MTRNATSPSASERWRRHYFACEVCCEDERAPERFRLCAIGSELRAASIEAYRAANKGAA